MSKLDQLRAMRERNFAAQQARSHVDNVTATLATEPDVINKNPRYSRFSKSASNAERQAKWRAANPELHRQRSRESMRKLRAKADASA